MYKLLTVINTRAISQHMEEIVQECKLAMKGILDSLYSIQEKKKKKR